MGPNGGGEPTGKLAEDIKSAFGSFDEFKEKIRGGRRGAFRQRLGLADQEQERQARDRLHAEPGQPADGRQHAHPRRRRVGTRLLPELPEPPAGLPQGVVERGELGGSRDQRYEP